MNKLLLTVAILIAGVATQAQIKLKGSDTVLPLSQKEAETFMKKNKTKVSVTGGGSGVGITALLDNTCDIAMSSRKLKMDEKLKLSESGRAFKEVIIAQDALAVIVNPGNKVKQLTRAQIEGIFTGKIKNWKDVGGDDMVIVAYSRESSSGTYEFFKEHVLNKKNYASTVLNKPATGDIVQSVSQTKGAIGYVGLAYLTPKVTALHVSYDGKKFVEPSVENAKNKTYPICRPLFYYYLTKKEAQVKGFVDFILSAEGQKVVLQTGYVPL
ncbi:MAG: PstS family phosphate ABC transporter substrate-binding protein [Bacteroidetes bacterium]|nr:PstS family phosphate ABC transporter substrate-binding protein [Bacteroidota bacterium]